MTHTRVTAENDEGSFYEKQCSESYSAFYISVEKRENCVVSATVEPIYTKFGTVMQNVSFKCNGR